MEARKRLALVDSHPREPDEWRKFEEQLAHVNDTPFEVEALLYNGIHVQALTDSGCLTYGRIKKSFALRNKLTRCAIPPKPLTAYYGVHGQETNEIVVTTMDVGRHRHKKICLYAVSKMDYDMLLGLQWMRAEGLVF